MEAEAEAVAVGDAASFDDLYGSTYGALLHLAVLLTGDRQRSAELVHDAFVDAHRRWSTVSTYDRPDLWMRRVLLNRCLSWRTRRRREQAALVRLGDRVESHDGEVVLASAVWDVVRTLPGRQAAAVTLVYGHDLSVADAAHVMGCSDGAVKTHLSRARARLAVQLEAFR